MAWRWPWTQDKVAVGSEPSAGAVDSQGAVREDGYINRFTGAGTARDRALATTFHEDIVSDLGMLRRWRSDDLIARAIEAMPTDAFRLGVNIKVSGDGDGKVVAEALQKEADRLNAYERVKEAAQYERAYGGAAIMPVLEGDVGELGEPLDEGSAIERVAALHVLEPRELIPATWYTHPLHPKWRKPETYFLQALAGASGASTLAIPVHESRLIIFPGIRVSTQTEQGQRVGWGDSIGNKLEAKAAEFNLSWSAASALMQDFAQAVFGIKDLATLLSKKNGEELLRARIAAMDMFRGSFRAIAIDAEETFERKQTPVTGLPDLLLMLAQRCAAAADMPLMKFLGLSPTGLNANSGGDFTTRAWYDTVDGARRRYGHPVRRVLQLLALQTDGPCRGVEPKMWSIEWPALWTPSEKEDADTRFVTAQADQIYFNMGLPAETIFRSRWGGDTYSRDMSVDWDALAKQQALDAQSLTDEDKAALTPNGAAAAGDAAPGDDEPGPDEPTAAAVNEERDDGSTSAIRHG